MSGSIWNISNNSKTLMIIAVTISILLPSLPAIAQNDASSTEDPLLMLVSSERMRIQVDLSQQSYDDGRVEDALSHIYVPLSVTFQSVKAELKSFIGEEKASELEAILADIPTDIKAGNSQALDQQFGRVGQILDEIEAKTEEGSSPAIRNGLISQTVVVLLKDAGQFYLKQSESPLNLASANAAVVRAETNYQIIADTMQEGRQKEVNEFFVELKTNISEKGDAQGVIQLISSIQRDLSESYQLSSGSQTSAEHAQYFANIESLYKQLVTEVDNGNYEKADSLAITAYLDNFEYLETPLEKAGQQPLMLELEEMMRIELRNKIKAEESRESIESFVNDINAKLATAQGFLIDDDADVQSGSTDTQPSSSLPLVDTEKLKEGFGVYQGEKKEIGDAEDAAKSQVRANIDQIRVGLDKTLGLYKQGKTDASLLAARTTYLDNYEIIELPLRPIDPDFTLEMEIKFGELRNLIQSKAPYEQVEAKVVEIRRGLDESERLVSGAGILAPSIAFSSSFSIIFREGLEGALIIGAILTYLEASRNERFKKHVYYGILIAIAATAITWIIAQFIIQLSGASKELIEAIAGISAVGVLFWVSFWVLNKIETKKWIEFVKAKVWKATATGSVLVFTMLSFFTIYREGFETVLFYQAMLSFAKYMEWYVVAGLVAGLAVISAVTFVVRKLGKRLPLRVLFGLTMGVGAYMSIVFIGNAVREFQEVGYISTTHMIGTIPRLDINMATMTGIHPTLETVVAQLVLLAVYMAGSAYVLFLRPRREKNIQMARKSRAELEDARKKSQVDES